MATATSLKKVVMIQENGESGLSGDVVVPGVELRKLDDPTEILTIEELSEYPDLIICEGSAQKAAQTLGLVKRSGKLHFVQVCIALTAEAGRARDALKYVGANEIVAAPVKPETIIEQLQKADALGLSKDDMVELDQRFAEESLDIIADAHRFLEGLNEEGIKSIYRAFHTLKGGASSLQLPLLANFIHRVETTLNAIREKRLFLLPQTREFLFQTFSYLEAQIEHLKKRSNMEDAPKELIAKAEELRVMTAPSSLDEVEKQKAQSSSLTGEASVSGQVSQAASNGILARTSSSIRVSNEKMDALQKDFRKILSQKVKLSKYCSRLNEEFYDEQFPKELSQILEELNLAALSVMDFFISLRVVPASRLKVFSERIISHTSELLKKPAKLDFQTDPNLEIDLPIVECLELSLTHLLRNSIDHGMETPDERLQAGKDPVGAIKLEIQKQNQEQILVRCSDDGKGINHEALKAAVAKKNLMSQKDLDSLTPEQTVELIFIPGLSTKEQVSETSGRGVGLDAVKQKIIEMGGNIKTISARFKGTTFEITLPRLFKL